MAVDQIEPSLSKCEQSAFLGDGRCALSQIHYFGRAVPIVVFPSRSCPKGQRRSRSSLAFPLVAGFGFHTGRF